MKFLSQSCHNRVLIEILPFLFGQTLKVTANTHTLIQGMESPGMQSSIENTLSRSCSIGSPVTHAGNVVAAAGHVAPSKTRIRWTQDLHERFVECVNQLGGADSECPWCEENSFILKSTRRLVCSRCIVFLLLLCDT